MRIDVRHCASIAALLMAVMSVVSVSADPVVDPGSSDAETAAQSGTDSSAGDRDEKSAAAGDETVPAEPFIPSEKISADSAVSFPVDI